MTIKWIFDGDEHFLRACGITPYPEYENDCKILEHERITHIMSLLNEHGTEFAYFDEYPQDDPFGFDMSAHGEDSPLLPLDEQHEQESYEFEVKSQLANSISEFLTFATKEQLQKFIDAHLN